MSWSQGSVWRWVRRRCYDLARSSRLPAQSVAASIECLLRCSCDPQNTINQVSSSLWLLTDYCPIRRRGISVSCETDESLIQG